MKKFVSVLAVLLLVVSLAACEGAGPEEDGQNPVMNIVGDYQADRASMHVEPTGEGDALITVTWSNSATETSTWVMSGPFDMETMTVTYNDCVRTDSVYKKDGSVELENIMYQDGTGTVVFAEEPLSATWNDNQEHVADGMVFEYLYSGDEE